MLMLGLAMMLMRKMKNAFSHDNGEKFKLMIEIIMIIRMANRVIVTLKEVMP